MQRVRLVLDTSTVVAAMRSPSGASAFIAFLALFFGALSDHLCGTEKPDWTAATKRKHMIFDRGM
jgi:hypothetical protein